MISALDPVVVDRPRRVNLEDLFLLETLRAHRRKLLGASVVVGMVLLSVYFYRRAHPGGPGGTVSASVLKSYVKRLHKNPYDGSLLLRAARSHYHLLRRKLRTAGVSLKNQRALIERGLKYFMRIQSIRNWSLSRRDYFYTSYLYYQLAQSYSAGAPRQDYFNRAKEMALKSYEQGYRSPELITLLGNLHFRTNEYRVALDYYSTLGDDLRDPDVLFNKAWVHRALGHYDRASRLIKRALSMLPERADQRRQRYRLAKLRVLLEKGEYRKVINRLQSMPGLQNNPKVRTMYANALIGMGMNNEARDVLEELMRRDNVPPKAKKLLNKIRTGDPDVGS